METTHTFLMDPHNPTVLEDDRTFRLLCARRLGCPLPGCSKLVLSVWSVNGLPPLGIIVVRECPRRKSLLCEFRLDDLLPSRSGR